MGSDFIADRDQRACLKEKIENDGTLSSAVNFCHFPIQYFKHTPA